MAVTEGAMDDAASAQAWRHTIRKRLMLAGGLFACWALAIESRLVYLQVLQHDVQAARAIEQRNSTIQVPGRRGAILDRAGHLLATSVGVQSVYAVPKAIEPSAVAATVARLCKALDDMTPSECNALAQRIRQNARKKFLYIKRQISPDETRRVLELIKPANTKTAPLGGISLMSESRRVYPNRELAAHVLGYVGTENTGLGGIEAAYDRRIRGRDGTIFVEFDARRTPYNQVERPPTSGATLELTLDRQIQHIAERELRAAVQQHDAVGGTVVVMDPRTGEVLALANEPTFNANEYQIATEAVRRNRGVQEIYEPGSTFKIVTASAAIEEHAFTPEEPIDVSAGLIRMQSRVIKDVHQYGVLSFTDVIVKSSNVGAVKVGQRLGTEKLGRYVRRFGFGERVCPDLPGETAGMLSAPSAWSQSSLASISMGYEIGVTPIQMASAFSSVANGGSLIQPRLVQALRTGAVRRVVEPRELRRTIDAGTVAEMTAIMEQVVERGTGKTAQVPGFTVAGKTGTAARIVNGRYSKSDYYASFVGFVPSRKPVVTILVVIDTPRGKGYPSSHAYYGGTIAAPVFSRVAEQTLRYLRVAPTVNPAPPVLVASSPFAVPNGTVAASAPSASAPSVDVETGAPVVPELRGLGAREAVKRLTLLGLTARLSGDGVVLEQEPAAGTPIESRGSCSLRLGRVPASAPVPQQ